MDPFYVALLLYFGALVLAVLDLLLPTGGILLVLAVLAALGSVLMGFRSSTAMGMSMLTLVSASVPALMYAFIRVWPMTPIGRRVILGLPKEQKNEADNDRDLPLGAHVGQVLVAEYPIMPTGQLRIGHRRYNAVVEGGIVEAGQRIKIVAVRERNLVVRLSNEPLTKPLGMPTSTAADTSAPPQDENLLDLPADELGLDSIEE